MAQRELFGVAPGDAVVTALPADQPLAYYLDRNGVRPGPYLRRPSRDLLRRRLFLVVDAAEGQTLRGLLAALGPGTGQPPGRRPRLLGRWESGSLYELDPHPPGPGRLARPGQVERGGTGFRRAG